MAIASTSKNYSGRKVDLSLFPEILEAGVPASMKLGRAARVIAGPSKVAQNFLRILLTPLGSHRGTPEYGSNFLGRIRTGVVRFRSDIFQIFSSEAIKVVAMMRRMEDPAGPDDEKIRRATLGDYNVNSGVIELRIQIATKNQEPVTFLLPVKWNN